MNLEGNKLGVEGGEAIGEALKVNASLTSLNLSSNNLAGETDWVKPAEVQGEHTVGATVTYQGREMLVSDVFSDGDLKMKPMEWLAGIMAIADALRVSASLTSVLAFPASNYLPCLFTLPMSAHLSFLPSFAFFLLPAVIPRRQQYGR